MLSSVTRPEVIPRIVSIKQTTAPNNTPLLETVKTHLKVESQNEAVLNELLIYVNNAVAYVELVGRRSLFTQAWTVTLDTFPSGNFLQLYNGPVQSITSFTTYNAANAADATFADYFVDTADDRLCLNDAASWPTSLRARAAGVVVYATGYGTTVASLPGTFVQAVLLLVGHWRKNRDLTCAVSKEMALGVSALLGVSRKLHL